MIIIIPTSGGKDSQACLLWAIEKYGLEHCIAVFCDVGWEALETYAHIEYLRKKTGIVFKTVKSLKYNGMVDLAMKKGRFPSTKARFCTEELKIKPMIDFILTQKDNLIAIDGVRADESESRSKKDPDCRYFKHYFEPYKTNTMIIERYNINAPVSLNQKKELKKAQERIALGKEDKKFFTYRKKEVFEWCKNFTDDLIRPFFFSSGDDVIQFSLNRGYNINPRYFKGYSRVGCDPCIMEKLPELRITNKISKETIQKVRKGEYDAKSAFFPPDKIPKRYHTMKAENGKTYPNIDDVVRYLDDLDATGDMFEDDLQFKCKSMYNICE